MYISVEILLTVATDKKEAFHLETFVEKQLDFEDTRKTSLLNFGVEKHKKLSTRAL